METRSVYKAGPFLGISEFILNTPKPLEKNGVYQYFSDWISNGNNFEVIK
ncbi:hypothetical protein N9005_05525 [Akkermansiaceae bacterium]|nr:hypothetical protein [Akkermansiaceae bacterium]